MVNWIFFSCYRFSREFYTRMETAPLPVGCKISTYARRLGPSNREGTWSCHTSCDTGLRLLWSHPKDFPPLVVSYDNRGPITTREEYRGPILTRVNDILGVFLPVKQNCEWIKVISFYNINKISVFYIYSSQVILQIIHILSIFALCSYWILSICHGHSMYTYDDVISLLWYSPG